MFNKLKAIYTLFQKGRMVSDPVKWKNGQVTVDAVHGLLWSAATVWALFSGTELPVTGEALDGISAAVVTAVPALISLYSIVATTVSTDKIGVSSKGGADLP
jgi:hypothetical protein